MAFANRHFVPTRALHVLTGLVHEGVKQSLLGDMLDAVESKL
jgi:hypothetical protein